MIALVHLALVLALDPGKGLGQCAVRGWHASDGLAGDWVRAITQTADGHLWIGTQGGLSRYDGASFRRFDMQTVPEMRIHEVRDLVARKDGSLWIGLSYQEPLVLANGAFRARNDVLPLPGNKRARALSQDRGGVISAVTDAGVFQIDGERATELPRPPARLDYTTAVLRDSRGTTWVGSSVGLYALEKDSKTFVPIGNVKAEIGALHEDRAGRLWVGAGDQLAMYATGSQDSFAPGIGKVAAVMEDREGSLWVGGSAGLARLREGRFQVFHTRDGLSDDDITTLFEDREGSLWVGTRQGGLLQFTDRTLSTAAPHPALAAADINCFAEDGQGALWIGTRSDGAYRWKGGAFDHYGPKEGLASASVHAILPLADGVVWLGGSSAGLFIWRDGTVERSPTPVRKPVQVLLPAKEGGVWIGTTAGLARLAGTEFRLFTEADGIPPADVRALAEDDEGALWVSTVSALYRGEGGRFTRQAPSQHVRSFLRDGDGQLWFTTDRDGLYRWRKRVLTKFEMRLDSEQNEAPYSDALGQILDDGRGHLWLTGRPGILRLPKAGLDAFAEGRQPRFEVASFETTDEGHGVVAKSRQGGALRTADGVLLFATARGLVTIEPERVRTNSLPPPVVIDRIVVDGQVVGPERTDGFPPGSGMLEFHYAGLSLLQPRKNRHRYRLEGFDDRWVEAGNRRAAFYAKVPPGDYRFRVQASNNDGVWNETGASFALVLAPHYYQTRWFMLLGLGALGAAAFGVHRARLGALNRQYMAVFDERARLARELHDTLLQGMTAVWAQLGAIGARLPPGAETAKVELRQAQDLVSQSLQETRDAVADLRERARSEGDLGRALSLLAQRLSSENAASCVVEVAGEVRRLPEEVQSELFGIGREALTNALKHASAKKVTVRLEYQVDSVKLTVGDDGRGFDAQAVAGAGEGHFGMLGLRERAARIDAALTVDSRPGGGTVVSAVWTR